MTFEKKEVEDRWIERTAKAYSGKVALHKKIRGLNPLGGPFNLLDKTRDNSKANTDEEKAEGDEEDFESASQATSEESKEGPDTSTKTHKKTHIRARIRFLRGGKPVATSKYQWS